MVYKGGRKSPRWCWDSTSGNWMLVLIQGWEERNRYNEFRLGLMKYGGWVCYCKERCSINGMCLRLWVLSKGMNAETREDGNVKGGESQGGNLGKRQENTMVFPTGSLNTLLSSICHIFLIQCVLKIQLFLTFWFSSFLVTSFAYGSWLLWFFFFFE